MNLRRYATVRALWTSKWAFLFLFALLLAYQFIFPQNSKIQLMCWKVTLGVIGAIVGYVTCKSFHSDMSLSKLLVEDKANELPDAAKFLGICIYRGFIMFGFIVGIMLGV